MGVPFFYDDKGTLVINVDQTELDSDWLKAARLQEQAKRGDKKAAAELKRMAATPLEKVPLQQFEEEQWVDSRMTQAQWNAAMEEEMQGPEDRRRWVSIHSKRSMEALAHNPMGVPIGLWVLDRDEIKTFYLPQFKDEQLAARRWAQLQGKPASQVIRWHYDHPDLYGDWYSLDKSKDKYASAEELGNASLAVISELWQ